MTPEQQAEFIASHDESELAEINWWLTHWARDAQVPPDGDWFVWFLRSGRGFGKTRTGAETVLYWVKQGYKRIALVGQTKADVRDTMIELGESSLMQIALEHNIKVEYQPSKRRVVFPDFDAVAMIYSGDEPGQLRGPQHEKAWVDELAKFKYPQEAWSNLKLGLRIGSQPQIVVTTTPRNLPIIKEILADSDTVDVRRNTYDNIANISPIYIAKVIRPIEGTRLGRQEVGGEILDDNPNALWKRGWIEAGRVMRHPRLLRIVIGVDPSGSKTGDAQGIVGAGVAAHGNDAHLYTLEDATMHGTPKEWATAAVTLYYKLKANLIVAEANYGGDMVKSTIAMIDDSVPVKLIHASRGKDVRAEPVSAIYEHNEKHTTRAHHVGTFPELEDELCQWEPGNDSPNRLDALVWAASELMLPKRRVMEIKKVW